MREHVHQYVKKAFSAVMAMFHLGSSTHGLQPKYKCLLYCLCILLIALYGVQLWFFDGSHNKGIIKDITKTQRHAAFWILGAFCTSPTGVVEALAGLVPVCLHLTGYEPQYSH